MFDAVIIGGGYAGLTAATYLVRSRRHVCVIDNRRPRNRFAAASHGFLGHDGASPAEILERARNQLHDYPRICTIEGEAVRAESADSGFTVHRLCCITSDGRKRMITCEYYATRTVFGVPICEKRLRITARTLISVT
jgi:thioredoxin reductase